MDLKTTYPRRFLKADEYLGDPAVVTAAYERLEALPTETKEQANSWLDAWNELSEAIDEVVSLSHNAVTKDTRDKDAEAELNRLSEKVIPLAGKLDEAVKQRFLKLPEKWLPKEMTLARRKIQVESDLFREENLPLHTVGIKQNNEYQKITGGWQTEFDGETVTPQQLRPKLESTDRDLRERAWRAIVELHHADYNKLNTLFDKMMVNRGKIAGNLKMDFISYSYKSKKRFSYGPAEAEGFREAIAKYVVPAVSKIMEQRRKKLGLDKLRPWDTAVDPDGAEPPKVYETLTELKEKAATVMGKVEPGFADAFRLMDAEDNLDLENRPGKAPGAYCMGLPEQRKIRIFANSVGTSRDFDTLMHEGGHAMHGFLSRHLAYPARSYPMEYAEVASMSLELLTRPFWGVVYTDEQRERLGRKQLSDSLTFLPFMAMIDGFQHWLYTDPNGTDAKARAEKWIELNARFRPWLDYSGLEDYLQMGWQYLHLFTYPFYYIEYGIAQLGAFQIFLRSQEDYGAAVADYIKSLSMGGTLELPELFKTAGVQSVMQNPEVLKDVTGKIMAIINE